MKYIFHDRMVSNYMQNIIKKYFHTSNIFSFLHCLSLIFSSQFFTSLLQMFSYMQKKNFWLLCYIQVFPVLVLLLLTLSMYFLIGNTVFFSIKSSFFFLSKTDRGCRTDFYKINMKYYVLMKNHPRATYEFIQCKCLVFYT